MPDEIQGQNCDRFLADVPEYVLDSPAKKQLFNHLKNEAQAGASIDALNKIAQELHERIGKELKDAQKYRYIRMIKVAEAKAHINQFKNPIYGVKSFLAGVYSNKKNSALSWDAVKKSWRSTYVSKLNRLLGQDDLRAIFNNEANDGAISEALFMGRKERNEKLTDPKMKKLADGIEDIYDELREHQNSLGADIPKGDEFIASMSHNPEKIIQPSFSRWERKRMRDNFYAQFEGDANKVNKAMNEAAFQKWKNFIAPKLDPKTYEHEGFPTPNLTPEYVDNVLRIVYDNITKGSINPKGVKGGANIAKKASQERFFRFKDAQSWIEYNKEYGSGNTKLAILNTIRNGADRVGSLQKVGPNPEMFWQDLRNQLIKESDDPNMDKHLAKVQSLWDAVQGYDSVPVSTLGAQVGMAIRSMQTLIKLPFVTITSFTDIAQAISMLRSNGFGLLDSYAGALNFLFSGTNIRARKELADSLGVMADTLFGHFANRFTGIDSPTGALSKAMGLTMRINGQESWDRALRLGSATTLARHIAQMTEREFRNLDDRLQRNLSQYGIGEKEWNLIRENPESMRIVGNKQYVTPDMIHTFTDESMAKYLGKDKLSKADKLQVQREIQSRLQTYFMDQTDHAQIQVGAAEKRYTVGGTRPGTLWGEAARMFMQFKSYGIGVTRRHLGRLISEDTDESPGALLYHMLRHPITGARNINWAKTGNSFQGLAEFFVNATLLGYISMAFKSAGNSSISYALGQSDSINLPDPLSPKTILASIMKGGSGGFYGDILTNQYNSYGKGLAETLAGPGISTIGQTAALLDTLVGVGGSKRLTYAQNAEKSLLQYAKNNIIPQTIYTKTAFDQLIYNNIMERIDPGYGKRSERSQNSRTDLLPIVGGK